jgi:hypoxanthine phosphoribosyltransferase
MGIYFKKYGRNSEQVELAVRTLCEHLGCSDIVAVPSSTAGETNKLQQLFGIKIVRTENVEKRKWVHSREIPAEYSNSYNINTAEINGVKILLVDDVCTTGKTIMHFKRALENLDFQVIPLALGLNEKLKDIKLLEWFYLYREEDKDMFPDIPDILELFIK